MTDQVKFQDSTAPAATVDKEKKISLKKPAKGSQIVIDPPEKAEPRHGTNEAFKQALKKYAVQVEEKTKIVLQAKANVSGLSEDVIQQVFVRGYKSLPLNSQLTREQYAMNRVNSFVAGGAAMLEDCDLLPIDEMIRTTVGMKGTGGGARPHIKREKSPYNGKTLFHVVDSQGHVKHTATDEMAAKRHLATKYRAYMEMTLSPMKRFEGTKSLVKTYKSDTPGEMKKEEVQVDEAKMSTAQRLNQNLKKAGFDADASRARIDAIMAKYKKPEEPKKTEKDVKESSNLANQLVALARSKGMNAKVAPSAEDRKKATAKLLKHRAKTTPQSVPPYHDTSMSSPSAYYASKKPGQYTGD